MLKTLESETLKPLSQLYLKRPIPKLICLRPDQVERLSEIAKRERISFAKVVSNIIDSYLGIPILTWFSGANTKRNVQVCEACPSFVIGEFSAHRFHVLCRARDCKINEMQRRENDFLFPNREALEASVFVIYLCFFVFVSISMQWLAWGLSLL